MARASDLGEKGNYIALYHNIICTNAHNKHKFGGISILVTLHSILGDLSRMASLGSMSMEAADQWLK